MLGLFGMAAGMLTAQATAAPQPAAVPVPVEKRTLAALHAVQHGLWSIQTIEGSAVLPHEICLDHVHLLLQLRHGSAACSSFVVADEARLATIQYSCPGAGSGRTTLRLLSPGDVRIESQGIADRAPFAFTAEARRSGDCPSPHALPAGQQMSTPAAPR